MVRAFLTTMCLLCVNLIYTQKENIYVELSNDDEKVIGMWLVEESPIYRFNKYEGDIGLLQPILSDSIICPFENCDSISGKIFIQFFVQANREISDVKVLKGINYDIDKEAVRIIKRL
jgi:hypothetical protein